MTPLFEHRTRKEYERRGEFRPVIEALNVGQSVHIDAIPSHFQNLIYGRKSLHGRKFTACKDGITGFRITRTA